MNCMHVFCISCKTQSSNYLRFKLRQEIKIPSLHCIQGVRRNVHIAGAFKYWLALRERERETILHLQPTNYNDTMDCHCLPDVQHASQHPSMESSLWCQKAVCMLKVIGPHNCNTQTVHTRHHSTGRLQCKAHMRGLLSALSCIYIHAFSHSLNLNQPLWLLRLAETDHIGTSSEQLWHIYWHIGHQHTPSEPFFSWYNSCGVEYGQPFAAA